MSKLRSLNTDIWCDTWFEELTSDQKLLFIYFITNSKTNMLGVYEISVKKISFETGISVKKIEQSLEVFESDGKIRYVSSRIILMNYLKHQNYNFNMKKSAIDTYNSMPQELKVDGCPKLERSNEGFETLLNVFGTVPKYEVEEEVEYKDEDKEEKYSQEVLQTFDDCSIFFDDHLLPDSEKKKNNWLETIRLLIEKDEIPPEKIIQIVEWTRGDQFWSKNFLSLTKLRKTNKDGVKYIVVFNENLKNAETKRNNQTGATEDEIISIYTEKFAKYNSS